MFSSSHVLQSGTPSIPYTGLMTLETDLNIWQRRAAQLVQPTIEGHSALSNDPYLVHLWTPAPPKMYLHPRRVKQHLFAQYRSPHVKGSSMGIDDDHDDDDDDEHTSLSREHVRSLTHQDTTMTHAMPIPVIRSYKSLERLPSTIVDNDEFRVRPRRRTRSIHACSDLTSDIQPVRFDSNYAFTLDETKHQILTRQVQAVKPASSRLTSADQQISNVTVDVDVNTSEGKIHCSSILILHESMLLFTKRIVHRMNISVVVNRSSMLFIRVCLVGVVDNTTSTNDSNEFRYFPKTHRSAVYKQAVDENRPFISKGRVRAARRARQDAHYWTRIDAIVALASAPARSPVLKRRNSFHEAFYYERTHPHVVQQRLRERQTSFDRQQHRFHERVKVKYENNKMRANSAGQDKPTEFQWTRDLWYQWLDQYIAELDKRETIRQENDNRKALLLQEKTDEPSSSVQSSDDENENDDIDGNDKENENEPIRKQTKKKTVKLQPIVNLHLADSDDRQILETEVHRLTSAIDRHPRDVFSLTRRGGLLRKLGLFHDALNDLSLAIYIEPAFMDAYWQRALIYMIFEHYDQALDSLNMCIKLNRNHFGAYKLRGDIYVIKNDLALAIANYSQAIRNNPNDHEAYFQRAQTYERRNEILLAMDDYVQVTQLNPKNIEAW
jgi:tetratricopeptide (TPR) repeat protein